MDLMLLPNIPKNHYALTLLGLLTELKIKQKNISLTMEIMSSRSFTSKSDFHESFYCSKHICHNFKYDHSKSDLVT